jgi:hypothetical protein
MEIRTKNQRVFAYNARLLFGCGRLFGRPEHLLKATNPTLRTTQKPPVIWCGGEICVVLPESG